MVVLLAWIGAVLLAVVVLTAACLGAVGHLRRLRRAATLAQQELSPRVRHLISHLPPAGQRSTTTGGSGRSGPAG